MGDVSWLCVQRCARAAGVGEGPAKAGSAGAADVMTAGSVPGHGRNKQSVFESSAYFSGQQLSVAGGKQGQLTLLMFAEVDLLCFFFIFIAEGQTWQLW